MPDTGPSMTILSLSTSFSSLSIENIERARFDKKKIYRTGSLDPWKSKSEDFEKRKKKQQIVTKEMKRGGDVATFATNYRSGLSMWISVNSRDTFRYPCTFIEKHDCTFPLAQFSSTSHNQR